MKNQFLLILLFSFSTSLLLAQTANQHIGKLVVGKKEKKIFNDRDSVSIIHIDTLIMKDKSSLQFFGKKNVQIHVAYAEIGDKVLFTGMAGQNNASDFAIDINFQKLGSLFILARGQDAMNGSKTFPNGDGGEIKLSYNAQGIVPQTKDKKAKNYLFTDVTAGGRMTNPSSDLSQIYSRIAISSPGLRGVPQGQIYSGSAGQAGQVEITAK